MNHETQVSHVAEMQKNGTKTKGRSILFMSGKGGIGKTNAALNIALALLKKDRRVTLLDANLQTTDIPILMGFEQEKTFKDALYAGGKMDDLVVHDESGLAVLTGGVGFNEQEGIEDSIHEKLIETLYHSRLQDDFLLIDTSPGINKGSIEFAGMVDEIVIVLTPEPATVSDSYALVKILKGIYPEVQIRILVNFVASQDEADDVFERFELVVNHFLVSRVEYLGFIPEDMTLRQAVCERVPVIRAFPQSLIARSFEKIAWRIST